MRWGRSNRGAVLPREAGGGVTRSAPEGASSEPLRRHANDRICRFLNLARQFACVNAHQGDALRREPRIATNVALRAIAHVVTRPVNLERETCFRAIEVEYVWSDRMLAAEY